MGRIKRILTVLSFLTLLLLSGCLYPDERRVENMGPVEAHIDSVKAAVERYVQDTGVYPILNSEPDTPIYEKYVIDMGKLYPKYLPYIPGNAFENGGPYRYVIVHPEANFDIRLLDLRISSEVGNVQRNVNLYVYRNQKLPIGAPVETGLYEIDYDALKMDEVKVKSPFTGQELPLLMTEDGQVVVDYSLDIGIFLNQKGLAYEGKDAREVLVRHSPFVPVKSLPYQLEGNELSIIVDKN